MIELLSGGTLHDRKDHQYGVKKDTTKKKAQNQNVYVKNDYTKNRAELTNKIKKMKREYISEAHDNFRKPE